MNLGDEEKQLQVEPVAWPAHKEQPQQIPEPEAVPVEEAA